MMPRADQPSTAAAAAASGPLPLHLVALGSTHRTAPLEVREKLAVPAPRVPELYAELRRLPGVRECLLLNTCNRVELLAVAEAPSPAHTLAELQACLARFHGLSTEHLAAHAFTAADLDAVCHLFEVSAGLDSQMVGEAEILGQVKDSYDEATRQKAVGPRLHRLLQKSFQAAKLVRNETGIARGQVSIGNVAVELAARIHGDLAHCGVLVLGAGEVADKVLQSLRSRGAPAPLVSSRREDSAAELAAARDATPLPWADWPDALARCDVVLASTAAPEPILTLPRVQAALRRRPGRPLFLVDLGLPRNIEASVSALENVFLYNLDDLSRIANENLQARLAEVEKGRALLAQRARQAWSSLR